MKRANRFALVEQISAQRADVVALDSARGTATVAVEVIEVGGTPPIRRRWVGNWYLVRSGGGWLLDQPGLQPG